MSEIDKSLPNVKQEIELPSEEEIAENDELWAEENGTTQAQQTVGEDLRSVGVTPGNLNTDMADAEPPADDVDVGGDDAGGDVDAADIEL